ncbi:hypothetical protein M9X92_001890 [Pyricularia oryzae]|nr:hypothetical protein M9X92_001890 [Pyricularia oryzae]
METGRSGHAAFNNAEIAKHLWENSRCGIVQNPENISENFLEKLKEMVRSHNIPHSAVVDLNGVNTKLLATEHKKRPREASPASLDRITEILDDMENGKVLNHRDLRYFFTFLFFGIRMGKPYYFSLAKIKMGFIQTWQKDIWTGRIYTWGLFVVGPLKEGVTKP